MYMETIRQANSEDTSAIKALISETVRRCVAEDDASYEGIYSDICSAIDSWVECSERSVYLVCEREDSIVGVVLIADFERMLLLFVGPSYQRRGIGRALLDCALDCCRRPGGSSRVTVNSSSYAAAFYRKYGFTPNGQARDLPGGCIPLVIDLDVRA